MLQTPAAPPRTPHTLHVLGSTLTFHATHTDTQGAWSLVEYQCPPGFPGPPPHIHDGFTEAFYVLEGTLNLELAGAQRVAPAGTLVAIPPGVEHTFSNVQNTPTRFLIFCTPGGFEQYFIELAALHAASPSWPPPDPSLLAELSARYDLRLAAGVSPEG